MDRKRRGLLVALLVLTPITAFYFMQLIMGTKFVDVKLAAVVVNSLWVAGVYWLMCAVTGYPVICSLVVHLLCGVWGMANYFVNLFRGTPILPWDFAALKTAAAVSGSYKLTLTWDMYIGLAVLLLTVILLRKKLLWGKFRPTGKTVMPRLAGAVAGLSLMFIFAQPAVLERVDVGAYTWQQMVGYCTDGALCAFFDNTKYMEVEQPTNATVDNVKYVLSQVEDKGGEGLTFHVDGPAENQGETQQKYNVIAIMNESWADYEDYGNLTLSEPVMDYIKSLDNAVFGHAYSSVFGAGTSSCEFEFLTGNSMAFLPTGSAPYQQYVKDETQSMASLLGELGYRTLAFHPGEETSWNRNKAYPLMGFDEMKFRKDMNVPQLEEHAYLSDYSDFQQIIWEFENKKAGEPLFLFNVTYQNHGGYEEADYPTEVTLTDCPGQYPRAEQYLTLANKTDEYFKVLVDYFSTYEEPTIIVMFGDHQPSVEQEFLDKAYGVAQADMTMEEYMAKFKVPFVIWSNRPLDTENASELTSLNFLGQHVLNYAGVETDLYGKFLHEVEQQLPVFTSVGYIDPQGHAYSHWETNQYDKLKEDYQLLQYDRLFGISDVT
ncbi:LTA synthase family protein [Pseudoflavonifractor capillosus]|uniref:LTA synthase family protein n=1 Tax=Pseudoflavonifractor capillosus TaxID=106588 RepID=UPI001FAEDE43|nr:LTA synthase family protein [Pseudoflavonifractor capillosus]